VGRGPGTGGAGVHLLGLHPGPDIGPGAAASLAGVACDRIGSLLGELTRAHLITESAPAGTRCTTCCARLTLIDEFVDRPDQPGETARDGPERPDRYIGPAP
jgi:hypothetical protein